MPVQNNIGELTKTLGEKMIDVYYDLAEKVPKEIVIGAMIGALAACTVAGKMSRENVIAALNSAFDDIEGK